MEAHQLLAGHHLGVAGLYLVATIGAAVLAVVVGLTAARRLTRLPALHRSRS